MSAPLDRRTFTGLSTPVPAPAPRSRQALRVLCVEDDADATLLLRHLLSFADGVDVGDYVATGRRGDAIRQVMDDEPFDLVFLDLHLPDSQGASIVADVALHSPAAAIIVLTDDDDLTVGVESLRAGASEFLAKAGLTSQVLARAIRFALERKAFELGLRALGVTDELTGVGNRRALDEFIARNRSGATRDGNVVGLVMIDIDGFKGVNDRHGHLLGDEVLRAVADRLRTAVRVEDLIARIGGDEFVIAFVADRKDRIRFLERRLLHELVTTPIAVGPAQVTASVGAALLRKDGTVVEALEAADRAMYTHKSGLEAGRQRGAATS